MPDISGTPPATTTHEIGSKPERPHEAAKVVGTRAMKATSGVVKGVNFIMDEKWVYGFGFEF